MIVASAEIDLRLTNHAHSLKDKRSVIRSLREKIIHKFKVSVAEVDSHDLWQRSMIGIALVGQTKREAETFLQKIIQFIENSKDLEIITCNIEIY